MKPTRIVARDTTKLTEMEPMLRDLHALASGGATLRDQMAGETRAVLFNSAHPPTLSTTVKKRPAAVLCLAARLSDGTGDTVSGWPVAWSYGGTSSAPTITISSLTGATASTDYDVILWISEG